MSLAVHFDLNGTLDEAEHIRQTRWKDVSLPYIRDRFSTDVDLPPEAFHASLGLASRDVIPAVLRSVNIALSVYGIELGEADVAAIYEIRNRTLREDGYDVQGYPLRDGAVDMLQEMASAKDLMTIVTSETTAHAQRTLERAGVTHLFSGIVGRDTKVGEREVRKKPDHEPYAVARDMINQLEASGVLHIGAEDTAPGIESLVRARRQGIIDDAVHIKSIQPSREVFNQLACFAVN